MLTSVKHNLLLYLNKLARIRTRIYIATHVIQFYTNYKLVKYNAYTHTLTYRRDIQMKH